MALRVDWVSVVIVSAILGGVAVVGFGELIRSRLTAAHLFEARHFASVQNPYKPSGFFARGIVTPLCGGRSICRIGGGATGSLTDAVHVVGHAANCCVVTSALVLLCQENIAICFVRAGVGVEIVVRVGMDGFGEVVVGRVHAFFEREDEQGGGLGAGFHGARSHDRL
jgi:hypothetical protein